MAGTLFSVNNYDNICRICTKNANLQSIFQYEDKFSNESIDLSHKLKVCCNVEIDKNDSMPKNICGVCSDALIVAYDLIMLCKYTDDLLRKSISMEGGKIKTECISSDRDDGGCLDDSLNMSDVNCSEEEEEWLVAKKTYKCYGCEMSFPRRRDRELHEDLHCPNMPPPTQYKCKICSATATNRSSFDEHIRTNHKKISPFKGKKDTPKCVENPSPSESSEDKFVTPMEPTRFMCEICGYQPKNKNSYINHQLTHQPRKVHECPQCSYHTTNRFSYLCHMKFKHYGHPLLKCDKCPYKTTRKEYLKVHNMRHMGEWKYSCQICQFKSVNHSNLKRHMTTHTNVRDYVCDVCGSAFKTKNDVKKHKWSVHENIKAWHCKLCKCKYSCYGDVLKRRHLKTKHGIDVENPDAT